MSDTQLVKDKIDIVDLISEYVQLKASGINHKGRCPFHNEKTPSFMVNRERQFFKCFGCGKNGDIFSFVQEMEGMEFPEALKYLANKAGVQLTNTRNEVNSSQKNRIKDINREASRFFHNFLLKMEASEEAREYLEKRGLKMETIEQWEIGFVPEQWDLLTQYLLKKGFGIEDLVAAGLTIKKDNANVSSMRGFYDRFRGRIMFPIWDVHDAVVGFTGRVLVETENSGGKYVNTPQTLIYDKSRVVFGLNKAKAEIKSKNQIVMVEGQMDVIACHQAEMKNVVASSGTALTEQQIKLLKRYSTNLNMAFDMDEAGMAAAKRGIDLALLEGMSLKVIQIPEGAGKDPDECLKKNSEVWFESVQNAKEIMVWYFERAFSKRNLNSPKDKQIIADQILKEIKKIPYAVEREYWLQELSDRLNVDITVLREDMSRLKNQEVSVDVNRSSKVVEKKPKPLIMGRLENLAEHFFVLLFRFPELYSENLQSKIDRALSTSLFHDLYERLKLVYNEGKINIEKLYNVTKDDGGQDLVDILLLKGEKDFYDLKEQDAKYEMEFLAMEIENEWRKDERKRIQQQLNEVEKSGNMEKLASLLKQYQELS